MRRSIEKSLILILCLYNSYFFNTETDIVFLLLSCLAISILLDLFPSQGYVLLLYATFAILCFYNVDYIIYLPLIIYNAYMDFKIYALILLVLFLLQISIPGLLLSIIAVYLSYNTAQYYLLINKNKITRDSLIEDTLYLRKYTEQLEISKEKNIHIAVLTERNRIARELHDSIGHAISSAILQVEALKIILEKSTAIGDLNVLQDTLKNGMDDIRASIHNLYNKSLDLESRIYELGKDIPGINVKLNNRIGMDISHELKFDILSVVKESITNCAKHSNGNEIIIDLFNQPRFYSISIKDNGTLFNHNANILDKGIGLSSMQELADKYNGFFYYGFDKGFKIHLTLMKS